MKYIMAGDRKVVAFDDSFDYKILNPKLAPIYIKNRGDIKSWIEERAVDATRANSRAVKSRQGLSKNATDFDTAMKVDAAAITDNFWVRDEKDERTWKDIEFRRNDFFGLALYRDLDGLSIGPSRTPELTNIGAREKGWKLEADGWWLYKNEPVEEIVSEYLTYRIGAAMGFPMAEYRIVSAGRFIKTKDFTKGQFNLQHIDGIMVDHKEGEREIPDDDYQYNFAVLKDIHPKLARQYLQICVLDALCENYDRHTKNYGFLTDRETGEIVSMAPNYDNNNSLFANYGLKKEREGGVLRLFRNFIETGKIPFKAPNLSEEEIKTIISEVKAQIDYPLDSEFLLEFLTNGIKKLRESE